MSNKQKTPKGASRTAYFARYKTNKTAEVNRKRKLAKLLKEHPNNKQLKPAIDNARYRRHTPKVRVWSKSEIREASLYKYFAGRVTRDIFITPSTTDAANNLAAALKMRKESVFSQYKEPKLNQATMFSLKERAHSKGVRAWI